MTEPKTEIRTLIATLTGGHILVPGSVVAGVISYTDVRTLKDSPDWLMGELGWNDWSLPVISFASMAGYCEKEEATARNRVLVIKSLSQSTITPYLGILISGIPRMKKVSAGSLTSPKKIKGHPSVFREVTLGDQSALIPDLDELTRIVEQTVAAL
jgi:chemosensory pili system protein ChpC